MLRTVDVVMIGLLLGGAAFTFKIKHDSEEAIARVEALQSKIRKEQEAIDVLKADWSMLTDPKRLEGLTERYQTQLQLEPLPPERILSLPELPERPPIQPGENATRIADIIGTDTEVKTGTVVESETEGQQ